MITVELTEEQAALTTKALTAYAMHIVSMASQTDGERREITSAIQALVSATLAIQSSLNASTKPDISPKSAD